MTIQCPHCNVSLDGEANPGDVIECPSCGKDFVLPEPEQSKGSVKKVVTIRSARRPIHNSARSTTTRPSSYSQPKRQNKTNFLPLIIIGGAIAVAIAGVAIMKHNEKQKEAERVAQLKRDLNAISESARRTKQEIEEIERRYDDKQEALYREYGQYDKLSEFREERRHKELMRELKRAREDDR